jgi:hypothetical protein
MLSYHGRTFTFKLLDHFRIAMCQSQEEFEYTKGVIRIRKSNKDSQHNDQKKTDKGTNNDLQNIAHKTKDRVTPFGIFKLFLRLTHGYSEMTKQLKRKGSTMIYSRRSRVTSNSLKYSVKVLYEIL